MLDDTPYIYDNDTDNDIQYDTFKWENIPEELIRNGLWCNWKLTLRDGALRKIPYNAETGELAKPNDKSTFHNFMTAQANLPNFFTFNEDGKVAGGLGLGIFNGYCAVDIDHCITNNKFSDLAEDIIKYCDSYTEYSPSGEGIRIIFRSNNIYDKLDYYINNSKIGLEIYIAGLTSKYVTITGNSLNSKPINYVDMDYIMNKYMRKKTYENNVVAVQRETVYKEFNIDKYRKDMKMQELWYNAAPGSNSNESELDLALCTKLSYYLNGDYDSINDAFMTSPYYNSKDDAHIKKWESRSDYRENTLRIAMQNLPEQRSEITEPHYQDCDLNDTTNAQNFITQFGHLVRYNVNNKMWMYFNGKYWQNDTKNNIRNFAEITIGKMKLEAKMMQDGDMKKAMFKNVKRAMQKSGKDAMISEAQHIEGIPIINDELDTDDYLLNLKNGTLDLRTLALKPHNREQMISRYVPYDISSKKPIKWLKFLNEVFDDDQDMIHYIQRIFGYSMTASTQEQCCFFFVGDGNNGKSLLLDIIGEAIGSYSLSSSVDILIEKPNNNSSLSAIARLAGARHVVTGEPKMGDKLNESIVKSLTAGNDEITARFLYGNEFNFYPKFKLMMAANYKPIIRGTDKGIWRRIKTIMMDKVIPDEKVDKLLREKLITEMPQIIYWGAQGAKMWYDDLMKSHHINKNIDCLHTPAKVTQANNEYRNDMDILANWMSECCVVVSDQTVETSAKDLYQSYERYVNENNEYKLSKQMWGRNMKRKFKTKRKSATNVYLGIRMLHSTDYTSKGLGDI